MKRRQLYLGDDMWKALHIRSRQSRTPISELVRQAVRDKYGNPLAHRRRAMQAWVGLWRDRSDLRDSETYVRQLRKGERLQRIAV
jgi:hypothetical protein